MKDIVHVHVISSNATMSGKKIIELDADHSGKYPDDSFLGNLAESIENDEAEMICANDDCGITNDDDAKYCKNCGQKFVMSKANMIDVKCLDWNGCDSGKSFHSVFIKHIVPHISGRIEAVALLEGDHDVPAKLYGFVVQDGVLTKCDVHVRLVPTSQL